MATINCDMGEAFGLYRMGDDAGLMPLIDIANVACGFHASDFNHILLLLTKDIANQTERPRWKESSFFRRYAK